MTVEQVREILTKRAERYEAESTDSYNTGKAIATREVLEVLELLDGQSYCPKCGSRFGRTLPDGRWLCHGLSSYAKTNAEYCGHVYDDTAKTVQAGTSVLRRVGTCESREVNMAKTDGGATPDIENQVAELKSQALSTREGDWTIYQRGERILIADQLGRCRHESHGQMMTAAHFATRLSDMAFVSCPALDAVLKEMAERFRRIPAEPANVEAPAAVEVGTTKNFATAVQKKLAEIANRKDTTPELTAALRPFLDLPPEVEAAMGRHRAKPVGRAGDIDDAFAIATHFTKLFQKGA